MKKSDFKSPSGEIVDVGEGLCAFIPHKLPPKFACDDKSLALIDDAMLALGELRAAIPQMPNPRLLTYPFTRREAVLSSKIEGTRTELEQLYLFETDEHDRDAPDDGSDVRVVHNYVVSLEYGLDKLTAEEGSLPICKRLLRELHELLFTAMEDEDSQRKRPGKFRSNQAFIGGEGISTARFVAPPAQYVDRLMDDLEKYVHAQARYHQALVRIAIAHYQFEAIHPFADGNGRVGRLLISLLLADWGILPQPLLYLSAYFESHVDEYRTRLWHVSCRSDWDGWVRFFLQGVCEVARDATTRAKRVIQLREEYRQRFQKKGRAVSSLSLIDILFVTPFITVPMVSNALEITQQGAKKTVDKLMEAGILVRYDDKTWRQIYVARPILEAIQGPAK